MKQLLTTCCLLVLALSLISCSNDATDPNPTPESTHLLNLGDGYRYGYQVGANNSTETFTLTDTVKVATAPNGEYYHMNYEHLDLSGEQPLRVILLLPFVRVTDTGLEYYVSNPTSHFDSLTHDLNPTLMWKLPYPAGQGAEWTNPDLPWKVRLSATDTMVYAFDNVQGYECYVYEIIYTAGTEPEKFYRVSIIPGKAVFKIEHLPEQITAVTYFWGLD